MGNHLPQAWGGDPALQEAREGRSGAGSDERNKPAHRPKRAGGGERSADLRLELFPRSPAIVEQSKKAIHVLWEHAFQLVAKRFLARVQVKSHPVGPGVTRDRI